MTLVVVSKHVLITTLCLTLVSTVAEKHGTQDNPSLRPRRNKQCPDGFGGITCKENINECEGLPYPCAGGIEIGSFCVDYDPPEKFKCGCRPGYNAVLPNAKDVTDPVPVEWRPLKCLPQDVCVDFLCHEDATCIVSSSNKAVCVCNDNLVGDGITNCSPPPNPTKPPSTQQSQTCKVDSDCIKLENSICVEGGVCKCKAGFYQSSGKGQCINEDECADGYSNDCHKDAVCADTEGSYTCSCKDGYEDLNSKDKPGTNCSQINECLIPSIHKCNNETEICVDLPPPVKWQCVAPTAAPTCNDAGITMILRVSAELPNGTLLISRDLVQFNCMMAERTSAFCKCEGKYPASKEFPDIITAKLIVNGATGTDGCCYCEDRKHEICGIDEIFGYGGLPLGTDDTIGG